MLLCILLVVLLRTFTSCLWYITVVQVASSFSLLLLLLWNCLVLFVGGVGGD